MDVQEIDTPALLLEIDSLEFNIEKMAGFLREVGCGIRPTIKVHKSPEIARRQIEAGAVGVTCSKVGEAEVMAASGISNLLISNQIVGQTKIDRLVGLASQSDLIVALDNKVNALEISRKATEKGSTIGAVIEVNVGMDRAGVNPGRPVLELARHIRKMKGLRFKGVMGYEGHLQGISNMRERKQRVEKSLGKLVESAELLREEGFDPEIVSCGGTNTYMIASRIEGVTEIEAGSYVFMDEFHAGVEGVDFRKSLSVLTTVTSKPNDRRAIVDAGLKSFAGGWTDTSMMPRAKGTQGIEFEAISEEHGHLVTGKEERVKIGDKLEFYPYYAPTTVDLFDRFYCIRKNKVVDVWPITGRGKSQ